MDEPGTCVPVLANVCCPQNTPQLKQYHTARSHLLGEVQHAQSRRCNNKHPDCVMLQLWRKPCIACCKAALQQVMDILCHNSNNTPSDR